jgi:hypothetical protein
MKYLSDSEIDRIAHAQDDGEWLVHQLTKLEWRTFARECAAKAIENARSEAFKRADEEALVAVDSFAWRADDALHVPGRGEHKKLVMRALDWLVPRGLAKLDDDVITVVRAPVSDGVQTPPGEQR